MPGLLRRLGLFDAVMLVMGGMPLAPTILLTTFGALVTIAQSTLPARPEFEVASIRLNKDCDNRVRPPDSSPGNLRMPCMTLETLIQFAYVGFANGITFSRRSLEIASAPDWVRSDLYDITAKANGNAPVAQMAGPMLQALLEDRFRLKIRRVAKESAVYALTIAKNGPKLQPAKEGGCISRDLDRPQSIEAGQPVQFFCNEVRMRSYSGRGIAFEGHSMKMAEFVAALNFDSMLDRPVVDQTNFTATFDVELKFYPPRPVDGGGKQGGGRGSAAPPDPSGPSIFTAVEQLGLKLVPMRGPLEYLIIDHVERPSEN